MDDQNVNFDVIHPRPILVVITGPSGVGKDAVIAALKVRGLPFHFVITAASRAPRPGERHGVDYFFLSKEEFEKGIANGEFIEHSEVYQEYKGVPRAQVDMALVSGKDVFMRLDVQGAEKVRLIYPDAILVFLVPTDEKEWRNRLESRKSETPETLKVRIDTARWEMSRLGVFNYVVRNAQGCLDQAVDTIVAIVQAEHARIERQKS